MEDYLSWSLSSDIQAFVSSSILLLIFGLISDVGVRPPLIRGEDGVDTLPTIGKFVMEAGLSNGPPTGLLMIPLVPWDGNIGESVNEAGGELGTVGSIGENVGDGFESESSVSDFEGPLARLSSLLPFLDKPLSMPLARDSCWILSEELLAVNAGEPCGGMSAICSDEAASRGCVS